MIDDKLNVNYDIKYDHRNLITEIYHKRGASPTRVTLYATRYYYDESGNRNRKLIYTNSNEFAGPVLDWNNLSNPGNGWTLYQNEFYVRGINGNELATYNDTTLVEWYVYGNDLVGKIKGTTGYYYYKDHLGSARTVYNDNGELVSAQDYDAWGYLLKNRSYDSDSSKFKFTGKERDKESEYDYFGARYYDGRVGRWGTTDPLIEKHFDFSPYNYVLDNPLYYIDPEGKQIAFPIWEAIKYTLFKTTETIAPVIGIPITPAGIIIGSLVNPSQLGDVAKYTEFLKEQRLQLDELSPRYTTEEIVVTALMSDGSVDKLTDKKVKELAKERGYEGDKAVERMKEQALKEEGIPKERASSFDVYIDKNTGKHYLQPKQEF